MVLLVQEQLHEPSLVDNPILNTTIAELVTLERDGIVLNDIAFDVRVRLCTFTCYILNSKS